jgi:hypothetical protein
VTINLYDITADSAKAASAPISCNKLVEGLHLNNTCNTKPLH